MITVIQYTILNVLMFGSLYFVAKFVEDSVQDFIDNYDERIAQLVDFKKKYSKL